MEIGWIKLHRKLISNPAYRNSAYLHVWIHLLLKASHRGDKILWNGGELEIKPGQCVVGRKKISLETGVSESTVERALSAFEKCKQIEQRANSKFRLITILNWKQYQNTEQPADSQRTHTRSKEVKKKEIINKTQQIEIGELRRGLKDKFKMP